MRLVTELIRLGSDVVVLGCTELSIINRDYNITKTMNYIVDSMEVLARTNILKCGKKLKLEEV